MLKISIIILGIFLLGSVSWAAEATLNVNQAGQQADTPLTGQGLAEPEQQSDLSQEISSQQQEIGKARTDYENLDNKIQQLLQDTKNAIAKSNIRTEASKSDKSGLAQQQSGLKNDNTILQKNQATSGSVSVVAAAPPGKTAGANVLGVPYIVKSNTTAANSNQNSAQIQVRVVPSTSSSASISTSIQPQNNTASSNNSTANQTNIFKGVPLFQGQNIDVNTANVGVGSTSSQAGVRVIHPTVTAVTTSTAASTGTAAKK